MDLIIFRNQPIPGIEVASTRPSYDQAVTSPGEHAASSEQVAPTRISSAPHDEGASDEGNPQQAKFLVPSHGRACPVDCIALSSPEARKTSRGSSVQGGSCLGDRRTLGRSARREPKASPDRSLHGPAGGVRGLALWDSRIRKQRLRSPARSGRSMVLSWRWSAPKGLYWPPQRPQRPATSSTELRCDPLCRGHGRGASSSRRRALLRLKPTPLSKPRALLSPKLALNSSPPPLLRL